MRRKKRLWRKVRVGIKTEIYRDVEKSVKNLIRRAKSSIEKKLAAYDRGNKRQFYATINREQKAVGPLKTKNDTRVTDMVEMADLINGAFNEVFTTENTTSVPEPEARRVSDTNHETVHFTMGKVEKKILQLRRERAQGLD